VRWSEPSESESVDGARPFPARRLGLVPQYAGDGERAGSPAGRRRERALEGGDATKPKSVVCLIVGYPGNELVGGGKRVPVDDACGGGSGQGQGLWMSRRARTPVRSHLLLWILVRVRSIHPRLPAPLPRAFGCLPDLPLFLCAYNASNT
jgi:hypothetical protein